MIKLEISLAVSLYLIISVIGVLILWLFLERKRTFTKIRPEEKFVWQCPICTFFYVDSQNEEFSTCPRCGSHNSRNQGPVKSKGGEKK